MLHWPDTIMTPGPVTNNMQHVSQDLPWLYPEGSLGDMLILSGVLKQKFDQDGSRYHLVRRSKYTPIFQNHDAIDVIGFPPKSARIISTNYRLTPDFNEYRIRPYQIFSDQFGLPNPSTEFLFLPESDDTNDDLLNYPPTNKKLAIIGPYAGSPRKMLPEITWDHVIKDLIHKDYCVVQVGKTGEMPLPGAFSLIGLTSLQDIVRILQKASLVITVDNFIMHAAYMAGTPTAVLWGPTQPELHGYAEHKHLVAFKSHCDQQQTCADTIFTKNIHTQCPLEEDHCMGSLSSNTIIHSICRGSLHSCFGPE
jgi:ADP-heptose:LPS heptosyltransferase